MALKIEDHIDVFFGASFLVHFYKIFMNLAQEMFSFFFFFITNMESTKSENNTIKHNKHVLNLIIK